MQPIDGAHVDGTEEVPAPGIDLGGVGVTVVAIPEIVVDMLVGRVTAATMKVGAEAVRRLAEEYGAPANAAVERWKAFCDDVVSEFARAEAVAEPPTRDDLSAVTIETV